MPDLSFRRFRPVLDLGKKLRLDPDAFVSDPLGVGLSLSDERRQPLAEIGGRSLVEAMVDLAGVDEVVSLAPAEGWR